MLAIPFASAVLGVVLESKTTLLGILIGSLFFVEALSCCCGCICHAHPACLMLAQGRKSLLDLNQCDCQPPTRNVVQCLSQATVLDSSSVVCSFRQP